MKNINKIDKNMIGLKRQLKMVLLLFVLLVQIGKSKGSDCPVTLSQVLTDAQNINLVATSVYVCKDEAGIGIRLEGFANGANYACPALYHWYVKKKNDPDNTYQFIGASNVINTWPGKWHVEGDFTLLCAVYRQTDLICCNTIPTSDPGNLGTLYSFNTRTIDIHVGPPKPNLIGGPKAGTIYFTGSVTLKYSHENYNYKSCAKYSIKFTPSVGPETSCDNLTSGDCSVTVSEDVDLDVEGKITRKDGSSKSEKFTVKLRKLKAEAKGALKVYTGTNETYTALEATGGPDNATIEWDNGKTSRKIIVGPGTYKVKIKVPAKDFQPECTAESEPVTVEGVVFICPNRAGYGMPANDGTRNGCKKVLISPWVFGYLELVPGYPIIYSQGNIVKEDKVVNVVKDNSILNDNNPDEYFQNDVSADIEHEVLLSKIFIYPNPSTGIFNLQTEKILDGILVTDLMGRAVMEVAQIPGQTAIDLSAQPNGIYFIKVSFDNTSQTIRVVKN